MATIFDPSQFEEVTHDESAGLQTSGVPDTETGEDNNDDDILLNSISGLLTTLAGLGAPSAANALGAARNQVLTFVGDADPELSFRLAGDVTTLPSGLMTTADSTLDNDNLRDPITLVVMNDTTIFGYANYGLNGQRVAFALVLSETATGAEITIVQYEALFNTNPADPDDFLNLAGLVYVDASESFAFDDFSAAPAGQNLWTSVSDSTGEVEILVTGLSLGVDTVNTRATSLGSNNQSIDPGEGLRFDFVDGQALPTSTTAKSLANIGYTSRIEGDTGGFTMAQVGGSPNNRVSAQITAYDSSDTASDFSDGEGLTGAVQTIVKVEVYLGNTLISSWQRTSATAGTETTPTGGDAVLEYRVTSFDNVTIDGLKANYRVSFTVADVDGSGGDDTGVMDRFEVVNVSTGSGNKSFDLGNIRLSSAEADSAEVGTLIRFEDDGPTAAVSTAALDTLVLDETRPVGTETDGDSDPAGLATVSANFADNFTAPDYGTDGAGSVSYALQLSGSNVASGLFAVDPAAPLGKGEQIVLNKVGSAIVGTVSGTTYFTISVDNDPASATFGYVTFTQSLNVWHADTSDDDDTSTLTLTAADLLRLEQTVTDADGDSDTAAINLGTGVFHIEDDGPTAAVSTAALDTLVLDETRPVGTETDGDSDPAGLATVSANFADNFTAPDYGTDGAGSVSYALQLTGSNVASGLFAVDPAAPLGKGEQIVLDKVGSAIVGTVSGTTYFTISVDNDPASATFGYVTFTQSLNVWHADTSDDDDTSTLTLTAADLLRLEQTVTDAEGDSDTAAINLGTGVFHIEDDGPLDIGPEHGEVTNAAGAALSFRLDEDLVPASFADNFGQDGPASSYNGVVFTGSATDDGAPLYAVDADGNPTGPQLTSGGLPIYLEGFGTDTLTAYTGSGATKQTTFTVGLDGSSGEYSVDMDAKIDNGSISFDNFGSGGAGLRYWLGVAGTQDASKDLLVTGATPNTNTINNDSDDIATGNQWINPTEMVRLDFVSGISSTTGTSDVNNIPQSSHYLVNDVGFTVMQTKGNSQVDVRIAAIDAARDIDGTDGTSVSADLLAGTLDTITSVTVIDGTTGTQTVYERSDAVEVGGVFRSSDGKVLWDDNTDGNGLNDNRDVIVYNIDAPNSATRDQVFVSTASGFTRLEITNVDANSQHAFAIGGFDVGGDAGSPIDLAFDVNVVDGDGDMAVGLIGITLTPEPLV